MHKCKVENCGGKLDYLGDGNFGHGVGVADILWCSKCGTLYLDACENKMYIRKPGDKTYTEIKE
jgi:hypothetical protein